MLMHYPTEIKHPAENTALLVAVESLKELAQCQQIDDGTRTLYDALYSSPSTPTTTAPISSLQTAMVIADFCQWSFVQMLFPGATAKTVTVLAIPRSLQAAALSHCHDAPTAGHLGYEKTLYKLQQEVYWVCMSRDVDQYYRSCSKCNASKPPTL